MAIPEAQLQTWSSQGSIQQSAKTYQTIQAALEAPTAKYAGKLFQVFLQGSYGNDTNIYAESDVDIVIRLDDSFYFDISDLPADQQKIFNSTLSSGADDYWACRNNIIEALRSQFGQAVKAEKKAIKIAAGNGRRSSDVIPAFQFRRYYKYKTEYDQDYRQGITFFTSSGERIDNFPRQHSEDLTSKHQATNKWFKPTIRIFKNMRSTLVDRGAMAAGIAPSYFIEGLLYNVPNQNFGKSYADTVLNVLKFLHAADRTNFVCANELYYLLRNTSVTWSATNCTTYLNACIDLWNNWGK
jgi:hypothetical protein